MRRAKRRRSLREEENKWFEEKKTQFAWITEQAKFISNRIGRQIANPRQGYATWLWLRACITASSMTRLFEPHLEGKAVYIDHASIAALARALIENVATCIYLGDQKASEDVWNARRLIMRLNDRVNRAIFLKQIGQLPEDTKDDRLPEMRAELEANPAFSALTRDQRGKILNGSNTFLHGRHNTMLVFGWGNERTAGIYKYLSSHAHSTAMSFIRTEANRVYEPDSNASKVTAGFALDHASAALGTGCLNMISLFPYVEAAFDELVFMALKNGYSPPVWDSKPDKASPG
ncbi:hypothetical protein H8B02_13335 [Bradyrhizobium sp. Pear77]|uniref:hypothetical protein n=1 Tax=Bradyrhizobium altum TaxID=1571202 RepID=UPI001E2D7CDF|nr:hypothetical protein [Bradyrhizobium altum]MCC8954396.1 hypothetical protein [Bradyrhizobium altum]